MKPIISVFSEENTKMRDTCLWMKIWIWKLPNKKQDYLQLNSAVYPTKIIPWGRVLVQKLIAAHLVSKYILVHFIKPKDFLINTGLCLEP
jgi:hypothetical protein